VRNALVALGLALATAAVYLLTQVRDVSGT